MYKQAKGADKVKIASNVYDVINIYDSGEIYYLTSEAGKISLIDYVTDDMKDADASVTEPSNPVYPNYPSIPLTWEYDTYEEYEAAYTTYQTACDEWEAECNRLDAEYQAAYEAYYAKLSRDGLRETLKEETLEQPSYSLCFYNGTEETVITNDFVVDNNYLYYFAVYAEEAPVIAYKTHKESGTEKVKLSEVISIDDIKSRVEDALFSSTEIYIAVKDAATVVEQEKEAISFRINPSGTVVYYIDDIPDEKDYGKLYRIPITNGGIGKAEVYDSDVCTYDCRFINDTELEYFKECKGSKGELYINKTKIDYDVDCYKVENYSDFDKIYYFTDWNDEKEYGTLKVYDGKKSVKIADDVHSFSAVPDGRVIYLCEYSFDYYKGELHEWSNGETRKIDDDVVCVFPIVYDKYRG